jgi:hypothetical protein
VKQLVLVLVIAAALFGVLTLPASSQTGDSLDAVVTPFGVAIQIDETEIDFGTLDLSPADDDRIHGESAVVTVVNVGSAPADLSISGSHAAPSTLGQAQWTLDCSSESGQVGANQFVLQFALDDLSGIQWDSAGKSLCPGPTKALQSGVMGDGGEVDFRLRMAMPTSTDGFSARTSTITVTATQAP